MGPSRPEAGGRPAGRRETSVRRCRAAHLEELPAAPSRRRDPPLEAVVAREELGSLCSAQRRAAPEAERPPRAEGGGAHARSRRER